MDNLEYIDHYFQSEPGPEETRLFEKRIAEEPAFAADLAFYLSTRQLAGEARREENRARFRELYDAQPKAKVAPVRRLWIRYAAVAAVLAALVFGLILRNPHDSLPQLADQYISGNMQHLELTMGPADDMQRAIGLYNQGQYAEALAIFEKLIPADSTRLQALENAGKACIRLGYYDQALDHFQKMEKMNPYGNPERFYEALTLMKRNAPGDKEKAKAILEKIVSDDLDKKAQAADWLKSW